MLGSPSPGPEAPVADALGSFVLTFLAVMITMDPVGNVPFFLSLT